MPPEDHRQRIPGPIETEGSGAADGLSHRFDVSGMMIRRGLDALEGEGLIKRVYGCATSNRGRSHTPPFFFRKSKSAEVQERIDRRAAEFTTCGHNVALDVGTTTLQIPGHLDDKRSLTIVTPNSPIANVLIGQPDLRHETVGRLLDLGIEVILA